MQLTIIIAVVAISVIAQAIKIIREDERMVVLRSDEYHATRGPGLTYLIPLMEQGTMVYLGRMMINIPSLEVTTHDGVDVIVGFDMTVKIVDPEKSVIYVDGKTPEEVALEELRSIFGKMTFDDITSNQQSINSELLKNLNERMTSKGLEVLDVEISDIKQANDAPENGAN